MSLLRDGIHRRAHLTARMGGGRMGASRMGWTPGQDDLVTLAREIKDENLTGIGPFYIWTETYKGTGPFKTINIFNISGLAALVMSESSTMQIITPWNLVIGIEATVDSTIGNINGSNLVIGFEAEFVTYFA